MVDQFPIDYMHQLCLGVMRKLLLIWIKGNRDVRISSRHVVEISERLINLKPAIPSKFARKPRGLNELERWKATEFRQLLLYTGQLVLKGIIRQELYVHFLSLAIASRILVSPTLVNTHWEYASELLVYFVEQGQVLYGKEFLVYNVHSMIHLAADAKHYGGLDKCSSFPFENYMHKLKKMVRSGTNPLAQLVKRISEAHVTKLVQATCASEISTKKPDNVFILDDKSCCEVLEKTNQFDANGMLYKCRVYGHLNPFFDQPCDSRVVKVWQTSNRWTEIKLLSSVCFQQKGLMFKN